jgi:hypothetical protein
MEMQIFWTFIFVNRMHRCVCVESDCKLKTHVRARSVFIACRTRRVAEDGSEYDHRSLRLKALVCFLTSVHHFYPIYCLSLHALPQYILSHAPGHG